MHYIAEVVIPPNADVVASVGQLMRYFCEEKYDADGNETGREDHADWWDFFVIGGRYSGHKLEASLDPTSLLRFNEILTERKVTVSGLRAGKEELSPASQIPMVDALWREMFPGKGSVCPLFNHGRDQYRKGGYYPDDVCKVSEVPDSLACERLILAGPLWDAEKHPGELEPVSMLVKSFWNRVEWQDTTFDGLVKPALAALMAKRDAQREDDRGAMRRCNLSPDWLVVTVDYHN